MHRILGRVVVVIALLAPAALAQAQDASEAPFPANERTVYLLTMGQGDQVWEKFGHNALWIHDPVRGTDRVYNYGVFDFHAPGYWGRFVRGNWIYLLAADDIYQTVAQYQYLNRTLFAQELNLTDAQEVELETFLETNLLPENREYRYDYFRDNCSTRIRDAIDRVIGGQIRGATEGVATGTSYRWHSRRLIADDEIAYTGMNAGLGPLADRPIDAWEEMFLPSKVAQRVRDVRVARPEGGFQPLVRTERVIYEAVDRAPERAEPPGWTPVFLLAGTVIAGLVAFFGSRASRRGMSRAAFAVITSLWSLVVGIGGVLLLALWTLTDHQAAHRNENLFHFDPLALGLVLLIPAAVYGARWASRPATWLALGIAAVSLLGALLQMLPGVDQTNGEIVALTLPVHLALAWSLWTLARRGPGGDREGTG